VSPDRTDFTRASRGMVEENGSKKEKKNKGREGKVRR
jgi:hypothetical protein